MGRFTYENVGNVTYLVYELGEHEQIDTMSLGMISNNTIPGVTKTVFSQMDYRKYLKYDVSAKITADQLLTGQVSTNRILSIFTGIVKALKNSEDFMLDPSSFILDMKYVFTNISASEISVICLPVADRICEKDLRSFLREVLFSIQFANPSDSFIGQLLNYLNSSATFSTDGLYELLNSFNRQNRGEREKRNESPIDSSIPFEAKYEPVSEISKNPPPMHTPLPNPTMSTNNITPSYNVKVSTPTSNINRQQKESTSFDKPEKTISWFYLMQHYNKENAALYKAQKERKKSGAAKPSKDSGKPKGKAKATAKAVDFGFEVPGQSPVQPQQPVAAPVQKPFGEPPKPYTAPAPSVTPAAPAQAFVNAAQSFGASADFGDTVYSGADDDDTTKFDDRASQPSSVNPTLLRKRNNERIRIDAPVFRIGRDTSFNNYAVTDNRYVGHTHCHIVSRDGEFFLVDDNSKNHTYLDGAQIPPSTEIKLSHGQKFRLSDEEFEFLLY